MLLVTGITGHTGKYFIRELVENKYKGKIRCTLRETSDTSFLDSSGLEIDKTIGDLNDKDFINKTMNGIETVFHIYNIHHSPMIIEAAIKHKVKRVILVHTTGIYSNFKNASQEYKRIESEVFDMVKDSDDMKLTILRPTMIYGDLCDSNMSKFIKMVDKLPIMPIFDQGRSLLQPVNARDLGKAYYKVLSSPVETSSKQYDLSGDRPIPLIDILSFISQTLGKRIYFLNVNLKFGLLISKLLRMISIGKLDIVEKVQRMGEDRSYSHKNATEDFFYQPITIEEGLDIEIRQYLGVNNKV